MKLIRLIGLSSVLLLLLSTSSLPVSSGEFTTAPPPPAFKHFFGNLHSHTSFSDGSGTPAEAYQHARDVGDLDFLAITEHNHKDAGPKSGDRADGKLIATDDTLYPKLIQDAESFNENGSFVAIYGQEFSSISKGNHTNIFMANKVITTTNGDYKQVFTDTWMADHGVTVIQLNHAWEGKKNSNKKKVLVLADIGTDEDGNYGIDQFTPRAEFVKALDGRATLFEMINGPALTDPEEDQVYFGEVKEDFYFKYLNMGLHLAPTGDQDNNYRTWGTITETRTVALALRLTREAILEAMKQRRVYATEDKDLKVTFTANGHIMGSIVPKLPTGVKVKINVQVSDTDEPDSSYDVELFYDSAPGGILLKRVDTKIVLNNGGVNFEHTPTGGKGYYLVRVKGRIGANEGYRAWTAPIWFE